MAAVSDIGEKVPYSDLAGEPCKNMLARKGTEYI
jgi:hypothetical protein